MDENEEVKITCKAPEALARNVAYRAVIEAEDMFPGSPVNALMALRKIEKIADAGKAMQVRKAREAGRTWQDIGDALGISRQAAQKRWGYIDHSSVPPLR